MHLDCWPQCLGGVCGLRVGLHRLQDETPGHKTDARNAEKATGLRQILVYHVNRRPLTDRHPFAQCCDSSDHWPRVVGSQDGNLSRPQFDAREVLLWPHVHLDVQCGVFVRHLVQVETSPSRQNGHGISVLLAGRRHHAHHVQHLQRSGVRQLRDCALNYLTCIQTRQLT